MKRLICGLGAAALCLSVSAADVFAQESRRFRAIPKPGAAPEGTRPVARPEVVSRAAAEGAVNQVVDAWENGELGKVLGDDFQDRQRLLDSMAEDVPRDAEIRLLGVRGVQTVQQFAGPQKQGSREVVSVVSLTVDSQVEFNDPERGFRRLRGQNQFLLRITEEVVE